MILNPKYLLNCLSQENTEKILRKIERLSLTFCIWNLNLNIVLFSVIIIIFLILMSFYKLELGLLIMLLNK